MEIASLVLGIIALVISFMHGALGFVGVVCAVLGLIFGLLRIKTTEKKGITIAGIVCSSVALFLKIVLFIVVIGALLISSSDIGASLVLIPAGIACAIVGIVRWRKDDDKRLAISLIVSAIVLIALFAWIAVLVSSSSRMFNLVEASSVFEFIFAFIFLVYAYALIWGKKPVALASAAILLILAIPVGLGEWGKEIYLTFRLSFNLQYLAMLLSIALYPTVYCIGLENDRKKNLIMAIGLAVLAVLIIVNPRLMISDAALICTLVVSIVFILSLTVVRIPLIAPIANFIPFLLMISGVRGSSFASFKFTAMYTLLSGLIMLSAYLTERNGQRNESVNSSSVEV